VSLFNAGMRAGKTTYYEGGHRVPCWVSWPAGKLPPPRDIAVPTQVQDLLPTVLDLCGVAVPKEAALDGRSLVSLLRGKEKALPERMLVVQYGQVPKKGECCVIWNQWRLVKGSELYDLKTDPGQKEDVAGKHPEVVKRMTGHYEEWWKGVEGLVGEFVPTHIGAKAQPLVSLTSSDWRDIYSDNSKHVRTAVGGPRGGVWTLHVEKAGEYEIALRRWARETDLPLGGDAGMMSQVIKPAVAKLKIGGKEHTLKTTPEAKEVVLRVALSAGATTLQAWFEDAAGKELCGAFYAYVKGP
jgi:arylsulfatase